MNGKYRNVGNGASEKYTPAEDKDLDIHMIYHAACAYLQTGPAATLGIEAHRKVDFVVSQCYTMTTNCRYADIVLPVTTEWEREGGIYTGSREILVFASKVMEPLYEAKSDQEICRLLCRELGIDENIIYPTSEKQQFFNKIAGCQVIDDDGVSYKKMVTITEDDIAEWGVEGEPQEGVIGLKELLDKGVYQVERKKGDVHSKLQYAAFHDDPDANPLNTVSGKFEIYCQTKADTLNNNMLDSYIYKGYPTYYIPVTGYEHTFKDNDIHGEKGEFPYLCYNPHYLRRSHSIFDNVQWLREVWPNPVYISKQDAMEKGVENGDTVLITGEFGKVLRQASVLNTYMPGVVGLPHGSWIDMDEETGIDRGGADNIICGPVTSGTGVSGYNNYVCNIEKYDGEPLVPDCEKPMRIIEF